MTPRTIFEHNGQLLIAGPQPNNENEIGKVHSLHDFDHIKYSASKDILDATKPRSQTLDTLLLSLLLPGNDASYDLKLENICLSKTLQSSQKLNNVCKIFIRFFCGWMSVVL